MLKLPRLSGEDVIKILTKKFGFHVKGRKGSHVKLVKYVDDRKIVTIVPLHHELKTGTLLGVLRLAEISRKEFIEACREMI